MKGIGIILMLIGHIPPGDGVYHVIYSFHMPLFFIVAGVFAKTEKMEWSTLRKYALRLLVPVVVTMAIIIALSPLHYFSDHSFQNSIAQVLSLLWAGDALQTKYGIISLDSMWFLVALFWGKCIFQVIGNLVNSFFSRYLDEILLLFSVLMSVGAVVLHRAFPFTPWGILTGLSAMCFLAFGWYLTRSHLNRHLLSVFVLCWILALRYGGIDMVNYRYGLYPLDILGAVGATGLVFLLSNVIHRYAHGFGTFLQWFGMNSLLILCVNTIDRKTYLVRAIKGVLNFHPTGLYNTAFHFFIEFILIALFIVIPVLKRVYQAKRMREITCYQ